MSNKSKETTIVNSTTPSGKLFTPFSYSLVERGVYRSAYPAPKTFPFIDSLRLKTMVCVSPGGEVRNELREYAAERDIRIEEVDVRFNQEPFLAMDSEALRRVLEIVTDPQNHPVLIFCTNGKVRTSVVVGCLRKLRHWAMSSVMEEFERFAEPEGSLCDEMFIQRFDPSSVRINHTSTTSTSTTPT